jgi:hypothetical protein
MSVLVTQYASFHRPTKTSTKQKQNKSTTTTTTTKPSNFYSNECPRYTICFFSQNGFVEKKEKKTANISAMFMPAKVFFLTQNCFHKLFNIRRFFPRKKVLTDL